MLQVTLGRLALFLVRATPGMPQAAYRARSVIFSPPPPHPEFETRPSFRESLSTCRPKLIAAP
jgi:hypothetical protein